jgi:hypothetical protein
MPSRRFTATSLLTHSKFHIEKVNSASNAPMQHIGMTFDSLWAPEKEGEGNSDSTKQ